MTEATSAQGEARMLIDGKLVDAASGKQFDNVNPATEEVLGQTADASAEEMQQAIGAARRAFDETTWSTDRSRSCSATSWWLRSAHRSS
jgi:aldehyde dehydrogenase (NAD+)